MQKFSNAIDIIKKKIDQYFNGKIFLLYSLISISIRFFSRRAISLFRFSKFYILLDFLPILRFIVHNIPPFSLLSKIALIGHLALEILSYNRIIKFFFLTFLSLKIKICHFSKILTVKTTISSKKSMLKVKIKLQIAFKVKKTRKDLFQDQKIERKRKLQKCPLRKKGKNNWKETKLKTQKEMLFPMRFIKCFQFYSKRRSHVIWFKTSLKNILCLTRQLLFQFSDSIFIIRCWKKK